MTIVKKYAICLLLGVFAFSGLKAQQRDVLFTIADRQTVTTDEFMQMYERNSRMAKADNTIDDYFNLFVNYKLKLLQAYDLGLDKDSSTIRQVEDYRRNLIKPYVNDPKVMDSLAYQAYNRMSVLVRASHILISLPANIAPADTVPYYQKAQMVLQKAKQGENFALLADEFSDDQGVNPQNGVANHGDLGYFTSMNMIYPFENACYSLFEDNGLKKPTLKDSITFCKTQYGYHIIKVTSVMEMPFQTITFAHVFIDGKKHSETEAENLIWQAYEQVSKIGLDSVIKLYSDDNYSKKNGGVLTSQKPNTIPPEYIDQFIQTKEGQITKPFKTRFGWHIVRYMNITQPSEFESLKPQIYERLSKDERNSIAINRFIDQSKQYYGFKYDSKLLAKLSEIVTDSVFSAVWQIPDIDNDKDLSYLKTKTLFSINGHSFTCSDFLDYIFENQSKTSPIHIQTYINKKFDNFSNEQVLLYASSHLEERYPEIQESIEEYKNGVLIFDLTDKNVWNKSLTDTLGLKQFYENHKSQYLYSERADATLWNVNFSLDINKIQKQIAKLKKKGKTDDEIKDVVNKKYSQTSKPLVSYAWQRFEKGINAIVDSNVFEKLSFVITQKKPYYCIDTTTVVNRRIVLVVNDILPIREKPFEDCKGLVVSDYQVVLEKQWIEEVKQKYPLKINFDRLNELKK